MLKINKGIIRLYAPYIIILSVYISFVIIAFIKESPSNLLNGFLNIVTSRSVLVTDYVAVGGLGATLLNSAIVGSITVFTLIFLKIKPNGANIMAIWMTTGFAFFGKNIFNMIPLTFGVWLFSKYNKEPFTNYSLAAMLVATLSPAVSEISFFGVFNRPVGIILGILFGIFIGFIFPALSAGSVRVHGGYNLYNMGFAGGLICMVAVSIFISLEIDIGTVSILSEGNNIFFAVLLYVISAVLFLWGILLDGTADIKKNIKECRLIFKNSGRLVSDFYYEHGNSIYINMAMLCAFATTLVLAIGAELNGPTIAGIFTITAFGSFGKHLKNVIPICIGAVVSAYFNKVDPTAPSNIISILFSTGLAPIAGQYGWIWGITAGFLHVNIVIHTSYLGGGMNLYNNGFAAGFVAMFMLPLITTFTRNKNNEY